LQATFETIVLSYVSHFKEWYLFFVLCNNGQETGVFCESESFVVYSKNTIANNHPVYTYEDEENEELGDSQDGDSFINPIYENFSDTIIQNDIGISHELVIYTATYEELQMENNQLHEYNHQLNIKNTNLEQKNQELQNKLDALMHNIYTTFQNSLIITAGLTRSQRVSIENIKFSIAPSPDAEFVSIEKVSLIRFGAKLQVTTDKLEGFLIILRQLKNDPLLAETNTDDKNPKLLSQNRPEILSLQTNLDFIFSSNSQTNIAICVGILSGKLQSTKIIILPVIM